jgi:hypothetical protein
MPSKKKAPARKAATKKSTARKSPAKAAAAKKGAARKSPAKQSAAKSPRKAAAKRTSASDSLAAETAAPKPAAAQAAPPAPKVLFRDACENFKQFKRRVYAPTQGEVRSGWRVSDGAFVCERRYPVASEYLTLERGFFVPANTRLQLTFKAGWSLGYNPFKKYGDRFQLRVMGDRSSTYLINAEGKSSPYKSRVMDLPPAPVATLYKLEISFHTNPDVPGVCSCKIGGVTVVALPS